MINVLFVESGSSGGGSFESLYQHLRVIDRSRIHPVVVYLNDNNWAPLVQALGIKVYVLTDRLYSVNKPHPQRRLAIYARTKALQLNRFVPSSYLKFARWVHGPLVRDLESIVRNDHVAIIDLNVQVARDIFGLFLSEKTGVPCISHLRSTYPITPHEFNPYMARFANETVAGYIANSEGTANYWRQRAVDGEKIQLIHNGVPPNDDQPLNIRKAWSISDHVSILVGCVTPLRNRVKVDEFLLRGFARFLERRRDAMLLIVGDGPMKSVLQRESHILGIEDHVIFTGFQSNAKAIIAGMDVSLVVSYYDSFSRVVLETMQAGTPLVATDAGGIREVVDHGENGILIEHGDEEAFASAVERLTGDDELRSQVVKAGRRTIEKRFSIERYASSMENIYMDLVTDRHLSRV